MRIKLLSLSLVPLLGLILLLFPLIGFADTAPEPEETKQAVATVQSEKEIVNLADNTPAQGAFIAKWLHMLDGGDDHDTSSVLAYGDQVPGDLAKILTIAGDNREAVGLLGVLFRTAIAICLGFGILFLMKKVLKTRIDQLEQIAPPTDEGLSKITAGALHSLPDIVGLFLFAVSSTLAFLLMAGKVPLEGRIIFQLILGIFLVTKFSKIMSRMIFAPDNEKVRPIELNEGLTAPLHVTFCTAFSILLSSLLVLRFFRELGAQSQTISWVAMILGSAFLATIALLILRLRKPVTDSLRSSEEQEEISWLKQQLAQYWHLPALIYILIVWFIWLGQESTGATARNGSLIISVLIVPIYFGISYFGKIIITAVIDSLNLDSQAEDETLAAENEPLEEESGPDVVAAKTYSIFRVLLLITLATWVLSLWGYNFPFASHAMRAIFESLVVLSLALLCWRYISNYIENKIVADTPEVAEEDKDVDDEFGGAVARGRSHTLLPMLRKVIGSVLIVMVGLIIVSSLGVNIGPLLAGAGVLGLAVGFGAQKLVSDVLSGFFFLLDDAFRVGEYIQAGSIRGTVESITLRNVLLRHHLGMLQVVPHSDLGAITNYMRGGIVIKFPLEFPYDTDIDKVRKIIKKVGQAMLTDEEIGEDFLQPLKSQGVYEITNSVMVIRVKFTAKPGKQFVIKREAFRRITEALNAKDIYYAHRKVIVDFPENSPHKIDEESKRKALEAGAAAVASEQEQPVK